MNRVLFGVLAVGGLLASTATAAEPFAIDLEIRSGKTMKTAHVQSTARGAEPMTRALLDVKAHNPITVKWKLSRTDPTATVKDVTVHFFAVLEETAGQPTPPKLDKGVVAESALSMDFGPKDKNEGTLTFSIDKPGYYLFRLETIGAAAVPPGHEDFAALDVKVR